MNRRLGIGMKPMNRAGGHCQNRIYYLSVHVNDVNPSAWLDITVRPFKFELIVNDYFMGFDRPCGAQD